MGTWKAVGGDDARWIRATRSGEPKPKTDRTTHPEGRVSRENTQVARQWDFGSDGLAGAASWFVICGTGSMIDVCWYTAPG